MRFSALLGSIALGLVVPLGGCGDDTPSSDTHVGDTTGDSVSDTADTLVDTAVDTTEDSAVDTALDTVEDTLEDTALDTVADTVGDTVEDTALDTLEDTVEDSAVDTATETIEDTVVDTVEDVDTTPTVQVVVNEIAAVGAPDDWIELFNAGPTEADLSGYLVRDDDPLHGYVLPDGTTLASGAYLVLTRGVELDFGLGGADEANLLDPDGALVDGTGWVAGQSPADQSWGRIPNGSGEFMTLLTPSPGAENIANPVVECPDGAIDPGEACDSDDFGGLTCERFGWGGGALACADQCTRIDQSGCTPHAAGLVINEVTSSGDDQVELLNTGAMAVSLDGWLMLDDSSNTYAFPSGTSVAAGARLVLVKGVDHSFGLGGADAVILEDELGTVVDTADWIDGEAVTSYCRIPDGTGGFRACSVATFGDVNQP
ncbi:MAG: lamin tail domain-containing protein [Myxococcota bacterium]